MRDILITLIVFGSIPLIFKQPWTGILLFSWISYMNPHRLTYGFAYSFQFALIAAVLTIIAFTISRENKRIPISPVSVVLFLFVTWTAITTITALAPDRAETRFIEFGKIQIMTILTLAMIKTKVRLNWLIAMIVFSIGFYGVRGGLFSIMTGGNYRVWGPPGSFFEDNNQLALTLIMTMPLMHYLQLVAANKWVRHMLSVMILLTLAAIIGTYSRGALLALSTMGFFLWLRSSKKLPVAFAAAVCIIGVLSFMPQKWFDRMDTIDSYEEDESASGRFDAWLFAINIANDRLLGGGFKVNTQERLWPIYNPESPVVRAPHSIYFEVLGEHGYPGLTLFLMLGTVAFFTCSRTNHLAREPEFEMGPRPVEDDAGQPCRVCHRWRVSECRHLRPVLPRAGDYRGYAMDGRPGACERACDDAGRCRFRRCESRSRGSREPCKKYGSATPRPWGFVRVSDQAGLTHRAECRPAQTSAVFSNSRYRI